MVKAYLRYIFDQALGAISGCGLILHENNFISACGQYIIQVNRKTGEIKSTAIAEKNTEITALCLVGNNLAVGFQDGEIILWDFQDSKVISTFYGHKAAINTMIYSQDCLYSGSDDNAVIQWDLIGEEMKLRLLGHTSPITSIFIIALENPYTAQLQEFIVTGARDGLVKIWDTKIEQAVETILSAHNEVLSLGWIEQESILLIGTNSEDLLIKQIINTSQGQTTLSVKDEGIYKRNSFAKPIQILYDEEGNILYILGSDKKIETYKIKLQKKKKQKDSLFSNNFARGNVLTLPSKVRSMVVYHEKVKVGLNVTSIALAFALNSIEVRHLTSDGLWEEEASQNYHKQYAGNHAPPRKLFLAENDALLLSISGHDCAIYEPSYGTLVKRQKHINKYTACTFLPKNRYYLLGDSEGQLQVMDHHSGEEVQLIQAHQTQINNIVFHPYPKATKSLLILTTGLDRQIKFWEVFFKTQTKNIVLQETKNVYVSDDINYASFSSKGDFYAISLLSNTIQIFYTDSHKLYLELYGHSLPVLQFGVTSDDVLLISGSQDKSIKIWGMDFGDCRKTIKAHQDQVSAIQTVNETHYFFSASRDKTLKYWDGDTYELIMQFDEALAEIVSIACGHIADLFFTGSSDKIIRKYIQTKEQVYVQEEEEKRVDKVLMDDYQKKLQQEEEQQEDQVVSKQQVIQPKTQIINSAEDVMNILDQIGKYNSQMEEEGTDITEEEKKAKLIYFNYEEPTIYFFKQLQNFPSTSLSSVFKFVHIKYIPQFIELMNTSTAINLYPELTSNLLNFLVINHEGQLFMSIDLIQQITLLKDKLKQKLQKEIMTTEFNIAAIDMLVQSINSQNEELEFI